MEQQKKSYYNCSVYGCLNTSLNGKLSFFKLPVVPERRTEWLRLIHRDDLIDSTCLRARVCEAHFRPNSIMTNSNRKLLKRNAIPQRLLPSNDVANKGIQAAIETADAYIQCDYDPTATANCGYESKERTRLLVLKEEPEDLGTNEEPEDQCQLWVEFKSDPDADTIVGSGQGGSENSGQNKNTSPGQKESGSPLGPGEQNNTKVTPLSKSTEATDAPLADIEETEAAVASLSDPSSSRLTVEAHKETLEEPETESDYENEEHPFNDTPPNPEKPRDVFDAFAESLADQLRKFPPDEATKIMRQIRAMMKRRKNRLDEPENSTTADKTTNKTKKSVATSKSKEQKQEQDKKKSKPKTQNKPKGRITRTSNRAPIIDDIGTNSLKRAAERQINTAPGKKPMNNPLAMEDPDPPKESSNPAVQSEKPFSYLRNYLAKAKVVNVTPPLEPEIKVEMCETISDSTYLTAQDPLTVIKPEVNEDEVCIEIADPSPSTTKIKIELDERCESPEEYIEITEKYPYTDDFLRQ